MSITLKDTNIKGIKFHHSFLFFEKKNNKKCVGGRASFMEIVQNGNLISPKFYQNVSLKGKTFGVSTEKKF